MTTTGRVPESLMRRLRAEMGSGEKLLHAVMPNWRAQWGQLLVALLFGLGWTAICVPMTVMAWAEVLGWAPAHANTGTGFAIFFSLFMIPFVAVGLFSLAQPFVMVWKSRRTVHAVTDQRLVNAIMRDAAEIESFKLDTINFIHRRDGANGSGSLKIGYGVEKDGDGDPRPLTTDWPGIPDAKGVEAIIRKHARWAR